MASDAERFYDQMNSLQALAVLIGQAEDANFDCKEWPTRSDAARGTIAKAACGFTNATGGVIVIGLKASGRGADTADVVQSLSPVSDRESVAADVLDIILKFVETGIEGIKVKTIPELDSGTSGFVMVLIPPSESAVRRSRVDSRFYVRVSSGTLPMEYFQIEERFGRRPSPRLILQLESTEMVESAGLVRTPLRKLPFAINNDGRGIAKFPGIRFKSSNNLRQDYFGGIDGNGNTGLPRRPSEPNWIVFRGGVDDVIYPGETRAIDSLIQVAVVKEEKNMRQPGSVYPRCYPGERHWVCEAMELEYQIYAEGVPATFGTQSLKEQSLVQEYEIPTAY